MWLEKKGAGSLQSNIGTLILLNLINQKALCQFTNPLLGDVGQDNNYRYTKEWLKTCTKTLIILVNLLLALRFHPNSISYTVNKYNVSSVTMA